MPVRLFIVHHSKGLQMRTYYLQDMAAAYLEAAYFTDKEEGVDAEFTREFEAAAYDACANFENACNLLEIDLRASYPDPTQLGHDLWYTRNGHGVGFWDRPKEMYGEHADLFTGMARAQGYHDAEFIE
jgi:hypothetical protein